MSNSHTTKINTDKPIDTFRKTQRSDAAVAVTVSVGLALKIDNSEPAL
jgi:hypothetical protein